MPVIHAEINHRKIVVVIDVSLFTICIIKESAREIYIPQISTNLRLEINLVGTWNNCNSDLFQKNEIED